MKSPRSLASLAARALSAEARPSSGPSTEGRAEAIDGIARAIRLQRRRRRLRWGAALAGTAAASIALAIGLGRDGHHVPPGGHAIASLVKGAPVVVRQGARAPIAIGSPLEPGDRLVVDSTSRATVSLPNGTSVMVERDAELLVRSAAPSMEFELASGSVRADVAKLRPGERFVLRTPDAEVEVHGTSFRVARVAPDPTCGSGTTTRVGVDDGVVAVRAGGRGTFVGAGDVWPHCDGATAAPSPSGSTPRAAAPPAEPGATTSAAAPIPPAPGTTTSAAAPIPPAPGTTTSAAAPIPAAGATASAATPIRAGSPIPAAASSKPAPAPTAARASSDVTPGAPPPDAPATSRLAAQNDLFERALARQRAGDGPGAVAGFEELLARYPDSHLAQSARAERMKILRGIDGARARAAARDYLDRYPSGFARRDAELIVAGD